MHHFGAEVGGSSHFKRKKDAIAVGTSGTARLQIKLRRSKVIKTCE
jgi:hypothetical protein